MRWWEIALLIVAMLVLPAVSVWWMQRGATATEPSDYEKAEEELRRAVAAFAEDMGKALEPALRSMEGWMVAMNGWMLAHAPELAAFAESVGFEAEQRPRRWWRRFRRFRR
jgi:hypothetical protein